MVFTYTTVMEDDFFGTGTLAGVCQRDDAGLMVLLPQLLCQMSYAERSSQVASGTIKGDHATYCFIFYVRNFQWQRASC
jgi:hypothetical protein